MKKKKLERQGKNIDWDAFRINLYEHIPESEGGGDC